MKNILIINAYSARNRGDAGIVVAMIHYLRELWPDCRIRVMSSYAEENRAFYARYRAESVAPPWPLARGTGSLSRYRDGLAAWLRAVFLPGSRRFQAYREADLVVSAGGGYIYSSRRGPMGIGLLNALYHYWLGPRHGKPTLGFPQSIGPLDHAIDRALVKRALRDVDLVFSREAISTKLLQQLRIACEEVPDIAFTLPAPPRDANRKKERRIGLTVLDWRFSKAGSTPEDIGRYLHKLAGLARAVLSAHPDARISIFPQVDVGASDSDVPISRELEAMVADERCRVVELAPDVTPEELVTLYSAMSVFVASRMHSAIFAIAGGVPTIGLAYQPKTKGTFELIGLAAQSHDVADFDLDAVKDQVLRILDDSSDAWHIDPRAIKKKMNPHFPVHVEFGNPPGNRVLENFQS